ncbi:MAG: lipoate--protein ligase [Oscillospiraceae bacterium]|nr:lipoate--protein ligase [Oscillospiraceae bacterium]
MTFRYISSPSTDPRWNLALEEYVFDTFPRDKSYFMLWQNHNTIVVGKNQNTAAEINGSFVRSRGITVVRRLSGGGTVYHDMGNLNFTFITDAGDVEDIDFGRFCQAIVEALATLGVKAEVNGRNDITIDGKKFSGNAQYLREGRIMHHGTLMFRSDLSVLQDALHVDREKLSAKGIASVVSRVTNIGDHLPAEVGIEDLRAALLQHIPCEDGSTPYPLTEEDIAAIDAIAAKRYATWEWTYGHSQALELTQKRRIEGCGTVEVSLNTDGGIITALDIHGDFFGNGEISALCQALVGCRCEEDALNERLAALNLPHYIHNCPQEALVELLLP